MRTQLGICVPNLGASQLNYCLIKEANALLAERVDLDLTVFFETHCRPCLTVNFALMPIYEIWSYRGAALATTAGTAQQLLNAPLVGKKFFLVWDLEWLRLFDRRPYRQWASLYRHPDLTLLARSPDHQHIIENCWNRPVHGVIQGIQDVLALIEGDRNERERLPHSCLSAQS